jgi:hypothetical protein
VVATRARSGSLPMASDAIRPPEIDPLIGRANGTSAETANQGTAC